MKTRDGGREEPQSLIFHRIEVCETISKDSITFLLLTKIIWTFYQVLQCWEPLLCKFLVPLSSFPVQSHHNMKKKILKSIHSLSPCSLPHAIVLLKHSKQLSPSFLNPSQHLWIWGLVLLHSPTDGFPFQVTSSDFPQLFMDPCSGLCQELIQVKSKHILYFVTSVQSGPLRRPSVRVRPGVEQGQQLHLLALTPKERNRYQCPAKRAEGKCISGSVPPTYHLVPNMQGVQGLQVNGF